MENKLNFVTRLASLEYTLATHEKDLAISYNPRIEQAIAQTKALIQDHKSKCDDQCYVWGCKGCKGISSKCQIMPKLLADKFDVINASDEIKKTLKQKAMETYKKNMAQVRAIDEECDKLNPGYRNKINAESSPQVILESLKERLNALIRCKYSDHEIVFYEIIKHYKGYHMHISEYEQTLLDDLILGDLYKEVTYMFTIQEEEQRTKNYKGSIRRSNARLKKLREIIEKIIESIKGFIAIFEADIISEQKNIVAEIPQITVLQSLHDKLDRLYDDLKSSNEAISEHMNSAFYSERLHRGMEAANLKIMQAIGKTKKEILDHKNNHSDKCVVVQCKGCNRECK